MKSVQFCKQCTLCLTALTFAVAFAGCGGSEQSDEDASLAKTTPPAAGPNPQMAKAGKDSIAGALILASSVLADSKNAETAERNSSPTGNRTKTISWKSNCPAGGSAAANGNFSRTVGTNAYSAQTQATMELSSCTAKTGGFTYNGSLGFQRFYDLLTTQRRIEAIVDGAVSAKQGSTYGCEVTYDGLQSVRQIDFKTGTLVNEVSGNITANCKSRSNNASGGAGGAPSQSQQVIVSCSFEGTPITAVLFSLDSYCAVGVS